MRVQIYVEGAGNSDLVRQCRRAFKTLFERAGMAGRLPAVIPCGGRDQAYRDFVNAPRPKEVRVLLLVDSEAPVTAATKWQHVAQRVGDGWTCPVGASEDDLHFMAQCMESWFLADRQMLAGFFGQGFRENALPRNPAIESIPKDEVYQGLDRAAGYHKGKHSFALLERLNPEALAQLPFAKAFLAAVRS